MAWPIVDHRQPPSSKAVDSSHCVSMSLSVHSPSPAAHGVGQLAGNRVGREPCCVGYDVPVFGSHLGAAMTQQLADNREAQIAVHTPGCEIVAEVVDPEIWQPCRRPYPVPNLIERVFRELREHVFAAVTGLDAPQDLDHGLR